MKSEKLNEIIKAMPVGPAKMKLLLILSLIDGYMAGDISDKDLPKDMKIVLDNL